MTDLVELSDAEHLFEYARQMVRCDAEMDNMQLREVAMQFCKAERMEYEEGMHLTPDRWAAYDEMTRLASMVAGLTASQASTAEPNHGEG